MSSSPSEVFPTPSAVQAHGLTRCFMYTGSSMTPTFRPGQLLYVRPTGPDLGPGDIIVFAGRRTNCFVTHRIISVTGGGWITRGDNNRCLDQSPISREHIIGRVEMVEDHGHLRPVRGGRSGLTLAQLNRQARRIEEGLWRVLGFPYRVLRRSERVHQILLRLFASSFEYVSFQTPQGTLVKVLRHGRVVAHWLPARGQFECHKPYDLILRPDTLSNRCNPDGFGNPDGF